MFQDAPAQHVYERVVLEQDNDSLNLLARQIGPAAEVLDLGMGTGALGRYLSARHSSITLDGVTLSHEEAECARDVYRRVCVADLDTADMLQLLEGQTYDCIVCADVLEHLKRPERILQQCHQLLKPGGKLLASVPNLGYAGLLADLLLGEFEYRPEGLLDRTHLRLFTRHSLERFFVGEGWHVHTRQVTVRDVLSSEFKARFDLLPPAISRYLLALPDASTYQFVWQLTPQPEQTTAPAHGQHHSMGSGPQALPLFSAQLYLAVDGQYDETRKIVCAGIMGGGVQTLQFDIPALSEGRYTHLRLDLADRPGFMHLQALQLGKGDPLVPVWGWSGSSANHGDLSQARQQQIAWSPPWGPTEQIWLQLLGDDPWIELPLEPDVLSGLGQAGGQLQMQASWPMSADYLQANRSLQQMAQEMVQDQAVLASRLQEIDSLSRLLSQSQQEKAALVEQITSNQQALAEANEKINYISGHLDRIESSKIYRWTRPLANLKYRLDTWRGKHPSPEHRISLHQTTPESDSASSQAPASAVNVIVPVYRSLADTRTCIQSVLSSTCQTSWHLVVVNDCSPEPEITQWLRELAAAEPRITLLENPQNLGFVASVNRGMSLHADRDVVLLNSDAEVANDWLDRIQRSAYAQERVGTVTPFSNNATICSYPRFCEANDLPAGWTTAQLDRLCAQHLARQTVQVPTAVGFCMYIRRACLNQVGLFDVDNFGKGYGEENDFCVRAEAAGWIHLHALDTFVRHAGGVSFGQTKSESELRAMDTMRRLHPDYERTVHAFIQRDPASRARLTLDLARLTSGDRITVLNVMHNRGGGSARHLDDMALAFAGRAQFLTLIPQDGGLCLRLHGAGESFRLQWPSLDRQAWWHLVQTLRQLGVAHVHYHHLMGHPPQVATLHQLLGVSHDFTAHDYYSFCPQITLTDASDRYCGERGLDQCRQCVQQRPAPMGVDIVSWRATNLPLLQTARFVIAPSQDTLQRMRLFAPHARVVYAPHEQLQDASHVPTPQPTATGDRPLKVAVLGALSKIKGADTLEAVAILARKTQAPVEFHLLGYGYRSLRTRPGANLTVHGAYQEDELADLLQWLNPDLAWFPAQCPETYSYTLSACLKAGLPIMASDLGSLPERLQHRPWTWLRDWQSTPQQWLDHLLQAKAAMASQTAVWSDSRSMVETTDTLDYKTQYLAGLSAAAPVQTLPALCDSLAQINTSTSAVKGPKSGLLKTLYWLRSHPWLSPVAKRIPSHLQRRVKSFFLN